MWGLPAHARESAYYLNGRLPRLALIGRGVRFPAGRWIRIAGEMVPQSLVYELVADLFPSLSTTCIPMAVLLTDFDVEEFERDLQNSFGGLVPK